MGSTLCTLAALDPLAAPVDAQAEGFEDLAGTLAGTPSGPTTVGPTTMQVRGPDGGCFGVGSVEGPGVAAFTEFAFHAGGWQPLGAALDPRLKQVQVSDTVGLRSL